MAAPTSTLQYTGSAQLRHAATAPGHIGRHVRGLHPIEVMPDGRMASMRYQSPLRYPGAKAGLSMLIAILVGRAAARLGRPKLFVEPFAGGAATSLRLASSGAVDRVLLGDADPLVARFWQVAAADTDWLIDRMYAEPVSLERWDYWRNWVPIRMEDRELAVKCLFLNRTTFSGILHGRAGPIGGRRQDSVYKLDCRFNKPALERRLRLVGDLYRTNRIADVWCKDWVETVASIPEYYPALNPQRVLLYLDPPYLHQSSRLYGKSFDPGGGYGVNPPFTAGWRDGWQHYRLADYLCHQSAYRWILSYDNQQQLLTDSGLYNGHCVTPRSVEARQWRISKRIVRLHYSVSSSAANGAASELLLTTLPASCVPTNELFKQLPSVG